MWSTKKPASSSSALATATYPTLEGMMVINTIEIYGETWVKLKDANRMVEEINNWGRTGRQSQIEKSVDEAWERNRGQN